MFTQSFTHLHPHGPLNRGRGGMGSNTGVWEKKAKWVFNLSKFPSMRKFTGICYFHLFASATCSDSMAEPIITIITHLMSISPALYSGRSILSYFIRMFGNKYRRAGGSSWKTMWFTWFSLFLPLCLSLPLALSLSVSLIVFRSNMSEWEYASHAMTNISVCCFRDSLCAHHIPLAKHCRQTRHPYTNRLFQKIHFFFLLLDFERRELKGGCVGA